MDKMLSQWSGKKVLVEMCKQQLPLAQLSINERKHYDSFTTQSRKAEWLKGRNALKVLLHKNNESLDTEQISFPNKSYSLTHNDGLAIAIAMDDVTGVGVDFEVWHDVKPTMVEWFLNNAEKLWLSTLSGQKFEQEFVRLWTVKEALFKATMNNEELGLIDFKIDEPSAISGLATVVNHPYWQLRYKCIVNNAGALCVAFCQRSSI
ncbi:4'-phosphopantetheinyl transferase superfamily protein [Thalassotalea psychrophila]|uniref:4'-phosphopantetheinyl transferase superfamily protein n=1 Tax=Thalassotalea psychrophila TaxID=3065647 RepID=A0ABY9U1V2_9GAMM|nr:4'-phosphopantetheinyl transferase superfamily protein [Colwelliaceae bacterium SQ149]